MKPKDLKEFIKTINEFKESFEEICDQILFFEDVRGLADLVTIIKDYSRDRGYKGKEVK